MRSSVEDVFVDYVYRATKEVFLQLVREKEVLIRKIVDEMLTEEVLKDEIKEHLDYDDDLRSYIGGLIEENITDKVYKILKQDIGRD